MNQLEIDFQPGTVDQFPDFMDSVRHSAYSCGRQFKAIAADLDKSPSELSRRLADNQNDPVHFYLKDLPALLEATKDLTPIYWLIEKFCESHEQKRRRSAAKLHAMLPELQKLIQQMSAGDE